MRLPGKKSIIVIIAVAAIVATGIYVIIYRPLIRALKKESLKYKTLEAEVLGARRIIDSVKTEGLRESILTEKDISLAINELTEYGKSKRIDFISITPKEAEKETSYKILPIQMEIKSTYQDLGIFLGRLGELKKSLITVRNFDAAPDKAEPAKLRTALVLNMYLLGQSGK